MQDINFGHTWALGGNAARLNGTTRREETKGNMRSAEHKKARRYLNKDAYSYSNPLRWLCSLGHFAYLHIRPMIPGPSGCHQ